MNKTMTMTMTTAVRALILCIAATLFYTAADAAAAGLSVTDESLTYRARFPDLDLSRVEGAKVLYARLTHASRVVCRPFESREMGMAQKYRECLDKALGNAVAGVNRPLLSQIHQLHTRGDRAGPVRLAGSN